MTKYIDVKPKEGRYLEVLAKCAYSINRPLDLTESLLLHFIEERNGSNQYYNGSGKRDIALKKLKITRSQYKRSFQLLLQSGCIIKISNDKRNNLCYFKFSLTINRLLKNKF